MRKILTLALVLTLFFFPLPLWAQASQQSYLLHDGEMILVGEGGAVNLHARMIHVLNGSGTKAFRAKTHELLGGLKTRSTASSIAAWNEELYVLFPKNLLIVDTFLSKMHSIPLEDGFSEIVLSRDGKKAFLINSSSDLVKVVDLKTRKVIRAFYTRPFPLLGVATQDGKYLYLSHRLGAVSKIHVETGREEKWFSVGDAPFGLLLSEDDKELFVADQKSGEVIVVGTLDHAVKEKIKVGSLPYRMKMDLTGKLFVSNRGGDTISVIDLMAKERKEIKQIRVGIRPSGLALTPDGRFLYSANTISGDVSVIDTSTLEVVGKLDIGTGPRQVAISSPVPALAA